MTHKLAAGVVVVRGEEVLLVKDKSGWSLPKGSTELGETFVKTAAREAFEETGFPIAPGEVAFVTEYTSQKYGPYLQVYYSGNLISEQMRFEDPDGDVSELKFVHRNQLRRFITFRPWVIPLEEWMKDGKLKYYTFDLDRDGFEV